jgi:transcriptional regulator with XRE-family HTH domain
MLSVAVKELRRQAGWSQEELAKKAGVSQQLIGKIETGKIAESRKLQRIAKAFNLTVEQLLTRTERPKLTKAEPPTSWPFSFDRSRFDRLSADQKKEIQGAVLRLILEYEDRRDAKPKSRRFKKAS